MNHYLGVKLVSTDRYLRAFLSPISGVKIRWNTPHINNQYVTLILLQQNQNEEFLSIGLSKDIIRDRARESV